MQILPGHASFIGAIDYSKVTVTHGSTDEVFVARLGVVFVDVEQNSVRIVVEYGEKLAEMSHATIKEYLNYILEKLEKHESLSDFQLKHLSEQKTSLQKMLDIQV